ncbi:hypothetical protein E3J74_03465 [Candidatus Bathyarchaeota archaeon]|nr:MAG: hypothetical protein E3J74_03465 [Candidatus Bathyarchaeota archaeon]TEU06607.1 MAG: hypothetical protein E3I90_01800 [Candidatus Bathyarchaeota archaeon]
MSEEVGSGLTIAEKLSGLIAILIGAIIIYFTYTSPPSGYVKPFSGIFLVAGFVLIVVGIVLVLARAE